VCAALRRTLASRSALDGGGGGSWAAATGLSAGVSSWKTRCVAAAAEGATWGQCAQRSVRRLVTGRSTRCGAGAARRCRAARKEAGGGIPGSAAAGKWNGLARALVKRSHRAQPVVPRATQLLLLLE